MRFSNALFAGNGSPQKHGDHFFSHKISLSITSEREQICDFSHPFYVTGLGIAIAPRHKTPWLAVMKKVFSRHYLKVVSGQCVLLLGLGTLMWWFERKRNPEQFGGGPAAGMISETGDVVE